MPYPGPASNIRGRGIRRIWSHNIASLLRASFFRTPFFRASLLGSSVALLVTVVGSAFPSIVHLVTTVSLVMESAPFTLLLPFALFGRVSLLAILFS
jgi:hypothetical protein